MAECTTYGIRIEAHNTGNRCWVSLQGTGATSEARLLAAARQVANDLRATIVELEPEHKFAQLKLRVRKKLGRALRTAARAINTACAPRKHRRPAANRCGRERPKKPAPQLRCLPELRATAR